MTKREAKMLTLIASAWENGFFDDSYDGDGEVSLEYEAKTILNDYGVTVTEYASDGEPIDKLDWDKVSALTKEATE